MSVSNVKRLIIMANTDFIMTLSKYFNVFDSSVIQKWIVIFLGSWNLTVFVAQKFPLSVFFSQINIVALVNYYIVVDTRKCLLEQSARPVALELQALEIICCHRYSWIALFFEK